jgi:hypothetical protein
VFVNVCHTYTPYPYMESMVADSAEPGKAQPDDGRFGVISIFAGRLATERLGSTPPAARLD